MIAWVTAFVWTLVVEWIVLELGLHAVARRWNEPLVWCLGLNLATHPMFSWWVVATSPGAAPTAVAEVAIAVVEAALLVVWLRRRTGWRRPAVTAVLANGMSYAFGVFVFAPLQ